MYKKLSLIIMLLCSVSACVSNARPKEAPDENLVEVKNPLIIPPHFELKQPEPEIKLVEVKKKSIFTKKQKASKISNAEQEIINKIQGKTVKVDQERSKLSPAEKSMLDKVNKL